MRASMAVHAQCHHEFSHSRSTPLVAMLRFGALQSRIPGLRIMTAPPKEDLTWIKWMIVE